MTSMTIQNCRALLGQDAELSPPVDIHVVDRRIKAIVPHERMQPGGTTIDAKGGLAAPGMINGHFHSGEHFLKGRLENIPLEVLMPFVRGPRPTPLTARQIYLRTMIGAIEALRTGTTTIVDDLNQNLTPELRAAVFAAYEDSGLRALVGSAMTDIPYFASVPYLEEEMAPEILRDMRAVPQPSPDALLDVARELARERHPRHHRVGYVLAPSAPQRCSEYLLKATRALADEFDLPIVIHVQETRLQLVHSRHLFGMTMIDYLGSIDFLRDKMTLFHAVWITPREIELIARHGTTVQHNPLSNLRMGSGLAPLRELLDAGVNVSIASDGCGTTDTLNMLAVLGLAGAASTLRTSDYGKWVTAAELWKAATINGARALGMEDEIGTIETGRVADLVVYRLDSIPFVPLGNAVRQLVHAERGASVDCVVVNGGLVMQDGRLTRIDEAALLAEIGREYEKLAPEFAETVAFAKHAQVGYDRIYQRGLKEPISPDTYAARLPERD